MAKAGKKRKFSIRAKAIVMILVFGLLLVETAMVYFSIVTSNTNRRNYFNIASNLSNAVAEVIDVEQVKDLKAQVKPIYDSSENKPTSDEWGSEDWEAYIAQFESVSESNSFNNLRDFLRRIISKNTNDINCLYLSYVDVANEHFIYLVDSAPEDDACPPGCIDIIYPKNKEVLTNPSRGFPPYTTDTEEYGYLVTAGAPIYDEDGETVIAYALVDISMEVIRKSQASNIVRLFIYLMVTVIVISVVGIFVVNQIFVKPVRLLTQAARDYDNEDEEGGRQSFSKVAIKTHDEIAELSESMKKMEEDINKKIAELVKINDELIQSQRIAAKMKALANKDALTGVRNKAAYDATVEKINSEIQSGEIKAFGIAMIDLNYLKNINDEFGHDCGDIALIKLCNLICAIFAHSPVYRVGGDEFIVILRNTDYKQSKKLVAEFNKKIEELGEDMDLQPYERISAAIGYVQFDKKIDKSAEDVFKRADEAMYIRKREMKEHNK